MTKTLKREDLTQFTGTEHWYRHGLIRDVAYTDGARYVAETGGAHWLLDEIAIGQLDPHISVHPFQVWTLSVACNKATLVCSDGNGDKIFSKKIEFTDFPLPTMTLWCADKVILLPSEY